MISPTERARLRELVEKFPLSTDIVFKGLLDSLDEWECNARDWYKKEDEYRGVIRRLFDRVESAELERDLLRADWEAMRECLGEISDFKPMNHSGCGSSEGSMSGYKSWMAGDCLADLKVKP